SLAEQALQNVIYSEVHFTISTHLANGANGDEVLDALAQAIVEGERRFGVIMRLIPDVVRNVGPALADRTLEWALAGRGRGVVAMGLSGSEARFPNEPFRRHFDAAGGGGGPPGGPPPPPNGPLPPPRGGGGGGGVARGRPRRRARRAGLDPFGAG